MKPNPPALVLPKGVSSSSEQCPWEQTREWASCGFIQFSLPVLVQHTGKSSTRMLTPADIYNHIEKYESPFPDRSRHLGIAWIPNLRFLDRLGSDC